MAEPQRCRALGNSREAAILAHRPLIEMCRAACIPVIAANAPRRLVRDYRKSDLDYCDFFAGLDSADQRWMPRQNQYLTGAYHDRFIETMSRHEEPTPPPGMPPGAPGMPAAAPAMPPGSPAMPPGAGPMPPVAPAMPPGPPSMPPGAPSMPPVAPPTPPASGQMPPGPRMPGPPPAVAPGPSAATAPAKDPTLLLDELAAASNRLADAASEVSCILEQLGASTQPAINAGVSVGTQPPAGSRRSMPRRYAKTQPTPGWPMPAGRCTRVRA